MGAMMTISRALGSLLVLGCMCQAGAGQLHSQAPGMGAGEAALTTASNLPIGSLPDSPGTLWRAQQHRRQQANRPARNLENTSPLVPARKNHRVIRPWETTQPLSAGGKLELSIMGRLSLGGVGASLFSAGWSHIRDSRPHYGTDSGAFGERLGATALKQTSESILSYGIFASAFHDDPRYYILGPRQPIVHRAIYSATRLVVTRKDEGGSAINWPKLAGLAASTALANAYYPQDDRGVTKSSEAYAASLGTTILTNEMHEFLGDALRLIHHKHSH